MKKRYTPENITELGEDEIFVFGSNLDGWHGAGAARLAKEKFGAKQGTAEGLTGQCYALPTVGRNLRKMPAAQVAEHIRKFIAFANDNPEYTFLVTKVGCGLAGHPVEVIAEMWDGYHIPKNMILPIEFDEQPEDQ